MLKFTKKVQKTCFKGHLLNFTTLVHFFTVRLKGCFHRYSLRLVAPRGFAGIFPDLRASQVVVPEDWKPYAATRVVAANSGVGTAVGRVMAIWRSQVAASLEA